MADSSPATGGTEPAAVLNNSPPVWGGLLRLRKLGEDIVALSRKPFCRLGDIAVRQSQSYTINKAVIEVE